MHPYALSSMAETPWSIAPLGCLDGDAVHAGEPTLSVELLDENMRLGRGGGTSFWFGFLIGLNVFSIVWYRFSLFSPIVKYLAPSVAFSGLLVKTEASFVALEMIWACWKYERKQFKQRTINDHENCFEIKPFMLKCTETLAGLNST